MEVKILKKEYLRKVERVFNTSDETIVKSLLKDNWYILETYLKNNVKHYSLGYAPKLKEIFFKEN